MEITIRHRWIFERNKISYAPILRVNYKVLSTNWLHAHTMHTKYRIEYPIIMRIPLSQRGTYSLDRELTMYTARGNL